MLKSLLSLVLQDNCPLCDRPAANKLCQYCQRQLKHYQWNQPSQFWPSEIPLFVWGKYEGKLKQAIAAFKYEKQPKIGELLGNWLGEAWLASGMGKTIPKMTAVPIPLHPQKLQERGFNQAEIIAKGFCQTTGCPLQIKALERVRNTQAMFGLTPTQRQQNIQSAFTLGKSLQYTSFPILLIDDIYTTGATATEAIKTFRSHRIAVVGIAAIATSPQRM